MGIRRPDDVYVANWVPLVSAPSIRNEIRELIMTDTLSEGLKSILFEFYKELPQKAE